MIATSTTDTTAEPATNGLTNPGTNSGPQVVSCSGHMDDDPPARSGSYGMSPPIAIRHLSSGSVGNPDGIRLSP